MLNAKSAKPWSHIKWHEERSWVIPFWSKYLLQLLRYGSLSQRFFYLHCLHEKWIIISFVIQNLKKPALSSWISDIRKIVTTKGKYIFFTNWLTAALNVSGARDVVAWWPATKFASAESSCWTLLFPGSLDTFWHVSELYLNKNMKLLFRREMFCFLEKHPLEGRELEHTFLDQETLNQKEKFSCPFH